MKYTFKNFVKPFQNAPIISHNSIIRKIKSIKIFLLSRNVGEIYHFKYH